MQWVQQEVPMESANVPWFISVWLVVWSATLQLLLKVYSHNRVTAFNNFGIVSLVSEVFGHCCVHFVGLSEDVMLPKNQQSTSDGPRPTHILFPVTIPPPGTGAAVGCYPAVLVCSFVSLLKDCGAGLSECPGWSTRIAQPGARTGIGDPWAAAIGSDHKVVT